MGCRVGLVGVGEVGGSEAYLIRQNRGLLITTPFSQQAPAPHPLPLNMEQGAGQSQPFPLSPNDRIKAI